MRIEIPEDLEKEEVFDWLVKNKSLHESAKKSQTKEADSMDTANLTGTASKNHIDNSEIGNTMKITSVINTTMVMDSHSDVHINGIWKKSLKVNKELYLLQEHSMKFDHVISDDVIARTEVLSWKELGYKLSGETEALIFESNAEREDNPFMFDKYVKGKVKNHSVGMRYIKLFLAINSEERSHKEEKKTWDKYIDSIVNRKDVEDQGFFWAVTEARVIEGSAVVKGSNPLTPTTSVEAKTEQFEDTPPEQPKSTQSTIKNLLLNI